MEITFQPIGRIFSPFKSIEGMPIQPAGAQGIEGSIEIFPEYIEGLDDLAGFSHIFLLYHLHKISEARLKVIPFLDKEPRGIFATRAPRRPNPIGLSIVKLLGVEENRIFIENVDILDGTPLLDIKPYLPEFDHHEADRVGWYEKFSGHVKTTRSDDRFR